MSLALAPSSANAKTGGHRATRTSEKATAVFTREGDEEQHGGDEHDGAEPDEDGARA